MCTATAGCEYPSPRPNIVVYLIDTLRRDHLGVYGYPRPVSPAIDAFARESVVFDHAVAQAPWTKPSVVSVFTGLLPPAHGVDGWANALPDDATTLAERLRDAGYRTGAFVANPLIAEPLGFGQGFETFESIVGLPAQHWRTDVRNGPVHPAALDSPLLLPPILAWLDDDPGGRPFFLYVHTLDPHAPYAPPQRFLERIGRPRADASLGSLERLRALDRDRGRRGGTPKRRVVRDVVALYDGEIAFTDVSFGALWDALRERGRDRDTLVVLLSDHGEAFWEHGRRGHTFTLYDEVLRVPLVVRPPGGLDRPRRVSTLVQHVDLLPTLLDCAGVSAPGGLPGTSLRGLVEPDGVPELPDRVALSFGPTGWSATEGRLQLIQGRGPHAKTELYDTATDPEERRNLVSRRPTWRRAMRRRAAAILDAHGGPVLEEQIADVPERIRDRLGALGYVRAPGE